MQLNKRALRYITIILIPTLLFSVLTTSGALAAAPQNGKTPPPVVTVMAITDQEVNRPQEYVGRVEAIQAVDLRARVEGFLEQVAFNEGAEVNAGDLLYVIEQAPYTARVNEARAKVEKSEASLTQTRQYLQRLQTVKSGGVSKTDIETAEAKERQAGAQLQEDEAHLEQVLLDLGYTTIKAPVSGRIGRTNYTRGNLVGPDSGALARIVQLNPIRVVYSVSENDYVTVKMSHKFKSPEALQKNLIPSIRLANGKMFDMSGRLDFSDNEVDSSTGTIAVRAVFDNPDDLLLPGQYVTILLSRNKARRMPVVPLAAVQEDREGRYVFVVDGESRVQQRRITTGDVIGSVWAIESGLMSGEKVIVQGVQKVRPGQIVKTVTDSRHKRG